MVDELAERIEEYSGEEHCTQCFAHVVNLIAKSLLNQFKPPKKHKEDALDALEWDLLVLAKGLEREDIDTRLEEADTGCMAEKDDVDGLINKVDLLSVKDRAQWETETRPVQMALVKVKEEM